MKLQELARLSKIDELYLADGNIEITHISDHSSKISRGGLFIAIEGFETDGHDYIEKAVAQGASLVIGEKSVQNLEVPYIQINDTRLALGLIASAFYQTKNKNIITIGITGTNGKTTTSFFLRQLLTNLGYSVGLIGSVYNMINNEYVESSLTTPSALSLQKMLHDSQDDIVIIEASSQGLEQHRLAGMRFDYALFTNLKKDHIAYHKNVENYFLAKIKLFDLLKDDGQAIINGDDNYGKRLVNYLEEKNKKVTLIGTDDQHDFMMKDLDEDESQVVYQEKSYPLPSLLPGSYNTYNQVLALAASLQVKKFDLTKITELFSGFGGVPGRFEQYQVDNITFVVDYAHTTDAFELLFETLDKMYSDHHWIQVYGYLGGRDQEKRQPMADVANNFADEIIFTTQDLNEVSSEEMEADYKRYLTEKSEVIMDRTLAIKEAYIRGLETEGPALITITGKGLEKYKESFEMKTENDKETIEKICQVKVKKI